MGVVVVLSVVDEVEHALVSGWPQFQLVYSVLGELREELGVLEVRSEGSILQLRNGGYALAILLVGVILSLGYRVVEADLVSDVVADVDSGAGVGLLEGRTS